MDIKIFGYLLAFIGIIGLALSTKKVMSAIPFIKDVSPTYVLVPAVVCVGVGVILLMSKGGNKTKLGKEVPIYKGKEIVGYRVLK